MSLLKTNEIQNYNGSSLTLTASTVSTSAQLNTGGNISVTGSLNVSDDSTTRTNLGLGTIATQDSDSITVTGGTATLGALTVSGSDSGDLVRITQTGSGNALVVEDSANPDSTPFVVDSSGNVGIATSSPTQKLDIVSSGVDALRLARSGAGGGIKLDLENGDGNIWDIFHDGAEAFVFRYNSSERMRIDSSGNVFVGTTSTPTGATGGVEIDPDGFLFTARTTTSPAHHIQFINPNGTVGQIYTSGSSTVYATSSDYRLKENITEITDAISRVKQLNPLRFNFIADPDITVDGFIAHEVQGIVPEAISGEKDAVNEDGSINPQGIDQSKLVPLLTAALQEAIALIESQQSQIDTLTARIEALKTT